MNVPGTYSVQVLKTPANCQRGGDSGAELSLSLWSWCVFMLQPRPREDSSYRTFREIEHPSSWRSFYAAIFEVDGSVCDMTKAVWSSGFSPLVISLLSGNVRVPAHFERGNASFSRCRLPWITSTLKMLLLLLLLWEGVGTLLYTIINILYTA